jgi:3-oxoadipate enol-lactonase
MSPRDATPVLQRLQREGAEVAFVAEGGGAPPILFFGSLALDFWADLAALLAPRHRLLRFDARGTGATRVDRDFRLEDIAADGAALLDHCGLGRAIAVGHAWGGRVAQVFARDFAARCAGLVLCGTGGQFPPRDTAELAARMADAQKRGDAAAWQAAQGALYCAEATVAAAPAWYREWLDGAWRRRAAQPADGAAGSGDGSRRGRATRASPSASYWATARVPTLLVYGREDRYGSAQNARDLEARIPGARLVWVDDAGHFVVRERPDAVADAIETFAAAL